jgi:phage FluMu protein Com
MTELRAYNGNSSRHEITTGGTASSGAMSLPLPLGADWPGSAQQPPRNGGHLPYQQGHAVGDGRTFELPGLRCQHCQAHLPRVYRTQTTRGFIIRERICPQCNRVNTTSERIIAVRERQHFSDPCE